MDRTGGARVERRARPALLGLGRGRGWYRGGGGVERACVSPPPLGCAPALAQAQATLRVHGGLRLRERVVLLEHARQARVRASLELG